MLKKFHLYLAVGIIAIILSVRCLSYDRLGEIIQAGFVSILLIAGLGFIAVGLTTPIEKKNKKDEENERY